MPTVNERNAAFDAVKAELIDLVKKYAPGFIESTAEADIQDPKNTGSILSIVDAALIAAEKVRNTPPAK